MAAPLRWFGTGAVNNWQVHHCENHDVNFTAFSCVPRAPAAAVCQSASPLLRKPRNARMRATSVACTALVPSLPIDLNNLCGCSFGTRIAYQHSKAQRSVLPGRVYVTDSGIRSQVGRMVSPAATPQGVQLRRLHSVRPVASAWLTGIHA
jgi:hypothetical protein